MICLLGLDPGIPGTPMRLGARLFVAWEPKLGKVIHN